MLLIIRIGDLHDLYGTRFRDDTWGTKLKRTYVESMFWERQIWMLITTNMQIAR